MPHAKRWQLWRLQSEGRGCGWLRGCCIGQCGQRVAAQAEGGFLACVQPLAQVQQVGEGGQAIGLLAVQVQRAEQAAQVHGLPLAVGVTRPAEPAQLAGVEPDGFGLCGKGGKVQLRRVGAKLRVHQQLAAARQGDEQGAGGEFVRFGRAVVQLQAQGGEQLQAGAACQRGRRGQRGGAGGQGRGALAGLPDGSKSGVERCGGAASGLFMLDGQQGAGRVARPQPALAGARKGQGERGQVLQRPANEHQAEGEGFALAQGQAGAASVCIRIRACICIRAGVCAVHLKGRLDDVGRGHLAELLQTVRCLRHGGEHLAVGAAFAQGACLAAGVGQRSQVP